VGNSRNGDYDNKRGCRMSSITIGKLVVTYFLLSYTVMALVVLL